ncbi:hypothetical protein GY45DRAFT_556073 [Cubamyces sp. BRFM 1775]|nr:hypothetical protein GY45DRAFT_556073 [Cubamyces sp. BRFM 1775]
MSWWRLRCGLGDNMVQRKGDGAFAILQSSELTVRWNASALFSQCAIRRIRWLLQPCLRGSGERYAIMGAILLCTARLMRCILLDIRPSIRGCAPRATHHGKLRNSRVVGGTYELRTRRLRLFRSAPSFRPRPRQQLHRHLDRLGHHVLARSCA